MTYLNLAGFGPSGATISNRLIGTSEATFSVTSGGTGSGNTYGGDANGNFNASLTSDAATNFSAITFTFSRPVTVILSRNTSSMGNFDNPDQWQFTFNGSYSFADPNGSFGAAGTTTGNNTLTIRPTPTAAPQNTNLSDGAWTIRLTNITTLTTTFRSAISGLTNLRAPLRIGVVTESLLPVRLLNFSASAQANNVNLKWQVAEEVNFDRYEVERSSEGENFTTISSVKAANASHYAFVDRTPLSGVNLYRLKMVDKDGSFRYSAVEKVDLAQSTLVKVATNPFQNEMVVELANNSSQRVQVRLLNAAGTVVLTKSFQLTSGNNRLVVPNTGMLSSGQYFVQVVDSEGKNISTKQVLKQ